ncbi:MAG TPA: phospholipase D-like domain-containing protein, partial [Anaerolineales bacterium]|nr:phospholipase D-like domain-containing protein [Anaerolineales bacterium]
MSNNASADFRWLRTGEDALASMLAAIESAEQSVRLEMYIYTASPVGEQFRDTLVRAQKRGVRVRVLIDALGSIKLLASFWEPLIAAGGEFSWFNPLQLKRLLYRDHRKILVCDERLAFVGGYNIAPEYQGDGVAKGWRDLGLEVSGP